VIGALFFILARDLLGAATDTWLLWYGLLFVGMVLWKPEGIAGVWQAMRPKWRHRPAPVAATKKEVAHGPV
jgi:branched-chain amino acid transport system permease protein